jgi:hypothetical protein
MLTHKQKVRLARKMRTPPEIHQQLQAILKTQQSLANRAIEIDDLSPSGKYSKKSKQTFANTYNSWIDLVRALVGDHTGNAPTQLAIAVCQGMLHSHFNFPGVKYVFSLVHEMGHQTARFTYSRVVQDQLSERLHTTLYTLATKKGFLSRRYPSSGKNSNKPMSNLSTLLGNLSLLKKSMPPTLL